MCIYIYMYSHMFTGGGKGRERERERDRNRQTEREKIHEGANERKLERAEGEGLVISSKVGEGCSECLEVGLELL